MEKNAFADLLSSADDIGKKLKELANKIKTVFQLMPSGKHMIGRDLGRLEPNSILECSREIPFRVLEMEFGNEIHEIKTNLKHFC